MVGFRDQQRRSSLSRPLAVFAAVTLGLLMPSAAVQAGPGLSSEKLQALTAYKDRRLRRQPLHVTVTYTDQYGGSRGSSSYMTWRLMDGAGSVYSLKGFLDPGTGRRHVPARRRRGEGS